MASLRETFTNPHVILPVVHVESEQQAKFNTGIAKECGADGVFLIDMCGQRYRRLIKIYEHVRRNFPNYWIGLNCLDLDARTVFHVVPRSVSGIWTDNAEIIEGDLKQSLAKAISDSKKQSGWEGLYFGGVAFKYQSPVTDLALVAETSREYMDVVTTSGPGTGRAADIEKIRTMRAALGNTPLAIASGISPENVSQYLGIADCFLVATSLLRPGTENFNPTRLDSLIKAAR